MRKLVIYNSQFGNTKIIAEKIADGAGAEAIRASDAGDTNWQDLELVVVGSPTQGGRPTKVVYDLISVLPVDSLKNAKVASFDTRFDETNVNIFLKLLLKTIKYGAEKINTVLVSKGGQQISKPEGFIVIGKEGPLKDGEKDRAYQLGKRLIN